MSIFPNRRKITDDSEENLRAEVESFLSLPPERRDALRRQAADAVAARERNETARRNARPTDIARGTELAREVRKRLGRHPRSVDDLDPGELIRYRRLSVAAGQEVWRAAIAEKQRRVAAQRRP